MWILVVCLEERLIFALNISAVQQLIITLDCFFFVLFLSHRSSKCYLFQTVTARRLKLKIKSLLNICFRYLKSTFCNKLFKSPSGGLYEKCLSLINHIISYLYIYKYCLWNKKKALKVFDCRAWFTKNLTFIKSYTTWIQFNVLSS